MIYIPIGQFASTPFFTLVGIYKYYSPMLLGYMANDNQIDLHSGGSFDYLFVMRKFKSGIEFKNSLLIYHLEGLLNIIYFFNNRTLNKMGFEIMNPSLIYRVNLFVNFIDLFWMYSLSQGKLSIPKVWYAKKASISGAKLVESKKVIEVLYDKMKSKTTA
ncbi:MAG: hypothetical protein IPO72_16460 [Saprospiraceae bacterium]|nr:hypothetical protein [Candidatus Vicinibacter affinis]